MATIKFHLQSKSDTAQIYVRFTFDRNTSPRRKTGLIVDAKDWSDTKGQPVLRNADLKNLKTKLDRLRGFLESAYNEGIGSGASFSGEWLEDQISIFNNNKPVLEVDILINHIDKFIAEAPYKRNQKNELGLSAGRIANLRLFRKTILRYQDDMLKGKSILLKNVNLKLIEDYKRWMFNQSYSVNYVSKNIANFKTICNDGFKNDIEVSHQLKNIQLVSENKKPEDIIYLSDDEQDKIKNAPIIREALLNARKWLLLGCLIGQRGSDLLNITDKNIKDIGGVKIIELKQQKTGKLVAIPLLPDALEIVESGMPYKISLKCFNEYLKNICEAAELSIPTIGRVKAKGQRGATIKGVFPKHQLISSHVCRRSFATNFYGRIPTPILINITAHGSEQMFLKYIGKTTYDNAHQMLEYFSKLTPRSKQMPLEIVHVRNAVN